MSEIPVHGVIEAHIASKTLQKSSFESAVKLPTNYVTSNYGEVTNCRFLTDQTPLSAFDSRD